MKKIIPFMLVAAFTACGQSKTGNATAGVPTVEELASNPERLKELREQCKTDRAKLGDELCNRVAVSS
ncbi:MAG: EexN family lipoprotein [Solimonas sp.]